MHLHGHLSSEHAPISCFCSRSVMAIESLHRFLESWWETSVTWWTKYRWVYSWRSSTHYDYWLIDLGFQPDAATFTGSLQYGSEVCWCPQHAPVWDISQRPKRESACGLYLHVAGLPPESPEISDLQRRGERRRQSPTYARTWNKEQLSLLRKMRRRRHNGWEEKHEERVRLKQERFPL